MMYFFLDRGDEALDYRGRASTAAQYSRVIAGMGPDIQTVKLNVMTKKDYY